jgi:hypothetical protein
MRRIILCALAPLLLGAPPASAAGFNLGWNDCPSGATYALRETFACDTDVGIHTMVASFVAPAGINAMSASEVTIDMQTGGASLASWWTFGSGQCRTSASLLGSFDFVSGPSTCYDYWQGGAIGALGWSAQPNTTNRCRIRGVFALPAGDPRITSIPEGLEVYSFKAIIHNDKSAGPGACAGCSDEACIVLNVLTLDQPAPNPPQTRLTSPAVVGHVLWQGWSTPDPSNQCPEVTPAKQQTWGSIKALYR